MADDTKTVSSLRVNGEKHRLDDVPADVPLLWVLREELGLKGTKFGCGKALCGACTVHIDGEARRACTFGLGDVGDAHVETIDALADGQVHAVQQAWIEGNVPQCGYCQSGQIMQALVLLRANPSPTDDDIDAAMAGNLCRCGTYPRIRAAIHRAAELMKEDA